ncbi:hypothetical protein, partial [Mesorhizobium sp. M2D.F.Ca.ET.223.01.1.1]|uniref:hypothetical protein n=1 Tax=Mesorhizobium sp. M2D.F.Ca.ET.223.01.1.1 TaxID=2563940 RepID=UPI001AEF1FE7
FRLSSARALAPSSNVLIRLNMGLLPVGVNVVHEANVAENEHCSRTILNAVHEALDMVNGKKWR